MTIVKELPDYRGFTVAIREGSMYSADAYVQVLDGEPWCKIYNDPDNAAAEANEQVDFLCKFWEDLIGRDEDKRVVVDGKHYMIGPPVNYKSGAGFGGRRWRIRFKDGHEVDTNNLWFQGRIPTPYRSQFPDNAEFITT